MELFEIFTHLVLTLAMLLVVVLIARSAVAGSKYSPILIIVVFGLALGMVLEMSGLATAGLTEFPVVGLTGGTTIIALIATFFVGGQKLRNTFWKPKTPKEDDVVLNEEEVILGTKGTQLIFLTRAFFILIGIISLYRIAYMGLDNMFNSIGWGDLLTYKETSLDDFYPLLAFFGVAVAIILIDSKAKIANKRVYLGRGVMEIIIILAILLGGLLISAVINPLIALPQIFFAMIISSTLGMVFSDWRPGPTMRALLFGGIPIVLAGVFITGGTRLLDAFQLDGMLQVMSYGFFGQLFWMFVGISLLVFVGKSNDVDILAPGMAGSLSHSGLTGACTAGDIGEVAKERAPIMINIPFFGHLFVFTILAISVTRSVEMGLKGFLLVPALIVVALGIALTYWALRTLRSANGVERKEIMGLILFSIGWQLVAVFGGFTLLYFAGMDLESAAMANSSAISHFGLFAAIQGGMFETVNTSFSSVGLISFIFAMPFLIHPLVFGMFGKAMTNGGKMPKKALAILAILGILGVAFSLIIL
ncbi:hypothetical protein KQ51_01798 [Candidatus Izimaplasma bacterium HR1]|jgi:hypothetical protein|uniref:hypothetical protein n=1 Tax=Candidatus Izimoplasma sp. HR1 TaxID=1541959 RepID=UPI0004F79B11|nr:hypothetical protein KQ51_01798 [Candidatus Izimaplasma bacterium HR1]